MWYNWDRSSGLCFVVARCPIDKHSIVQNVSVVNEKTETFCILLIFYNDKGGVSMDFEHIAQRIKDRCKEKGYTIKELLENCEYNRNFMYDLKCGKTTSVKMFAKIADYLDCSIDYLIGRTDNPDINK